jgi:iron complex transport system substrate-binding protein
MRLLPILAVIFLCMCTAGCIQSHAEVHENRTIVDAYGVSVDVPRSITRIVSLAPSETEIVCELGKIDLLVGRTDYCDYPASVESIQSVGGPKTLGIEAIVGLKPDLVLATTVTDSTKIEGLRAMGLPVVVFKLGSVDDICSNIAIVGEMLDCGDTARQVIGNLHQRRDMVHAASQQAAPVRVLYVLWDDPLTVAGNGTLQHDLITIAGGVNLMADVEGYVVVSDEAVVSRNPDVIIVSETHAVDTAPIKGRLLEKTTLADISAIQSGRVYTIEGDLANRPGPRVLEAMELFASCIHV